MSMIVYIVVESEEKAFRSHSQCSGCPVRATVMVLLDPDRGAASRLLNRQQRSSSLRIVNEAIIFLKESFLMIENWIKIDWLFGM